MKKPILLIVVMIILPCAGITQTVQIGLSPSLSYILGGSFYTNGEERIYSTPPHHPLEKQILNLGLKKLIGYQIDINAIFKHPGLFAQTKLEQQFLSDTDGGTIVMPSYSSLYIQPNTANVKLTSSILALHLGCGYKITNIKAKPYLAGTIILSHIGAIEVGDDYPGPPYNETIKAKSRMGLGCQLGLEWPLSRKLSLDAQFHLKSYAMFLREEQEDDFITAGLSAGLLYTIANSQ